jgi:molybdate transport system ATP-binding protein
VDPVLEVSVSHRLSRLDLRTELALGQETLALVGPSGAGKTSVLRSIAGLFRPTVGLIVYDGRAWLDTERGVNVPPDQRRVGMVFQEGALFPHLTVTENVAYGIRRPRRSMGVRRDRAKEILTRFGLSALAGARPGALSGGERQRVALARAVASDPAVLLLDEPLSALDPATKAVVAGELGARLRELRLPAVLVSHDFSDVLGLADRIAVMEDGRIVQVGTGSDLLEAPVSAFVASLTGVNYFEGWAERRGDLTEIRSMEGRALFLSTDEGSGKVGVVVPPWDVAVSLLRPEGSALNTLAGPISRLAGVGNRVRVTVASHPHVVAELTSESVHRLGLAAGVLVIATWKATGTRVVPRGEQPTR